MTSPNSRPEAQWTQLTGRTTGGQPRPPDQKDNRGEDPEREGLDLEPKAAAATAPPPKGSNLRPDL